MKRKRHVPVRRALEPRCTRCGHRGGQCLCQPGSSSYEVVARLPAHTAPGESGGRICVLCGRAQDACLALPCPGRLELRRQADEA